MKRVIITLALVFLVLTGVHMYHAEAQDIPSSLRVGVTGKCGSDFEIKLSAVPSLSSGIAGYGAQADLQFLILRVAIKNLTGQAVSLTKDSFSVTEYYNKSLYGEYALDKAFTYYSAYIGNDQLTYDDPLSPGEERPTTLVFQVYPNAEGWVFNFTPTWQGQGNEKCELRFRLHYVERY